MMLCSLATVKTYLGITDTSKDDLLTLMIKQISSQIENYLGYSLSRKENTELHSVNNEQLLLLDNQPIQSVESVKVKETEITDFKLIEKYTKVGMLYRGLGWCGDVYTRGMTYDVVSGYYEIEVKYTSGYYLPNDTGYVEGNPASLPFEIMSACLMGVSELFNVRMNGAEGIKAHSEGGISDTFGSADGGSSDCGLSAKVCGMLVDYRRQAIA